MGLNPFKDSNLNDLQQNIKEFIKEQFGEFYERLKAWKERTVKKGKERITVMFIPHSEKKILNFHVSIFAISSIVGVIVVTIVITSIVIVNHTSTIKEVSKLRLYGQNSKVQIQKYKEEINKLYDIFQKFKPEITYLYSLTPDNNVDTLWAKGGAASLKPPADYEEDQSPPLELLNIEEIERELKITKDILGKIKVFLETRKKILESTPSLWPVNGHIVSRFGERVSPYTFRKEFHQGIDFSAFPGTEIRATAPGVVDNIEWNPVYGLTVSVKHKYGFTTIYSHCQRVSAEKDQKVSKGEVIGYVGKTGRATRHMCYYQIRIGTDYVDPAPYINKILK
jgi:murein DD-endopeptidase MepM/ murein hydrolase activator NlpD